ncbi:MAG: polymerase, partial [Pseudomonadota bacterium]
MSAPASSSSSPSPSAATAAAAAALRLPAYAELRCVSNFSFLTGASHPEELVERAVTLGYSALALTDECSVAGVVRAHSALKTLAREAEAAGRPPPALQFIVGAQFVVRAEEEAGDLAASDIAVSPGDADPAEAAIPPFHLIVLPGDLAAYGRLCQLITRLRRRAPKGSYLLRRADLEDGGAAAELGSD